MAVWTHRWITAKAQYYKTQFIILGLDMSHAFNTINSTKLLTILQSFPDTDHTRNIQYLLSNTALLITHKTDTLNFFTNTGTPQGDGLSPILFIIYLEAALKGFRQIIHSPTTSLPRVLLAPSETIYADDLDKITRSTEQAKQYKQTASTHLNKWDLFVNATKTELTTIMRHTDTSDWRKTKKLGSLIGDTEDTHNHKCLASIAIGKYKHLLYILTLQPNRQCITTSQQPTSLDSEAVPEPHFPSD
jgi:hypothetical protein